MADFASKNLTTGELDSLVSLIGGEEQVRRILFGELNVQLITNDGYAIMMPTEADRLLTVPAHLTFEERVACGSYGLRDTYLKEKWFPVTSDQIGDWKWKFFPVSWAISLKDVNQLMRRDGYQAAAIGHLLAFGEKYPEEQLAFPIIGLGSVAEIGGRYYVPALGRFSNLRELKVSHSSGYWDSQYHFLGVCRYVPV